MDWIPLLLICAHLIIGLFCASLATKSNQKPEPWFLAGTLLGGLALIGFFFANRNAASRT